MLQQATSHDVIQYIHNISKILYKNLYTPHLINHIQHSEQFHSYHFHLIGEDTKHVEVKVKDGKLDIQIHPLPHEAQIL
jgi:hypothetical protein